jgi:hypothetical protein
MEVRVHLKVCEGCGCLWYRRQAQTTVYCRECEERFREFPSPVERRRGRAPRHHQLSRVWAVADATGGAE